MKFHITTLTIFMFTLLLSCSKQIPKSYVEGNDDTNTNLSSRSSCSGDYTSVTDGMLQFPNFNSFWSTYTCLLAEYENHTNNFFSPFGLDSTQEALANDTANALDFSPFSPLLDFENAFEGFTSLRQARQHSEDEWMNDLDMNPDYDPYSDVTIPRVMRSIFNSSKKVMIGDSIFTDNLVSGNNRAYNDCWQWKATNTIINHQTGKRYKCTTGIHWWATATTLFSETESFKKKSNGKWVWYFTKVGTGTLGAVHNPDCGERPNISLAENWRVLPWGAYVSKNRSISYKCKAKEGVAEFKSKHTCSTSNTTKTF